MIVAAVEGGVKLATEKWLYSLRGIAALAASLLSQSLTVAGVLYTLTTRSLIIISTSKLYVQCRLYGEAATTAVADGILSLCPSRYRAYEPLAGFIKQ